MRIRGDGGSRRVDSGIWIVSGIFLFARARSWWKGDVDELGV